MVENTALQTKTARAIVRKANPRSSVAEEISVPTHTRTIVCAFVDPNFDELHWQWDVDLSDHTQIRMVGRQANFLTLFYSLDGPASSEVDPGDYQAFRGTVLETGATNVAVQTNSADVLSTTLASLEWVEIPEEQRTQQRLSISTSTSSWTLPLASFQFANRSGFLLAVQAI